MTLGKSFRLAINWLVFIWVLQLINMHAHYFLNMFGLVPQSPVHLIGIFTSPFLHGSLEHIMANSLPLFVFVIFASQTPNFWRVTWIIIFLTGMAVWLVGRPGVHVGASGLIMGYWSYLLVYGWLIRRWKPVFISIWIAFFYGGMLFTLIDLRAQTSFESHIFGFIFGLLAAWVNARKYPRR